MNKTDFTKPTGRDKNGDLIYPTVEFTEDCWNTIYTGICIGQTLYTYLIKSPQYGTHYIPKEYVKLKEKL
jgi:hypothetical protein